MIRRPPRSTRTDTLFPYTTLFRSRQDLQVAQRSNSSRCPCGSPTMRSPSHTSWPLTQVEAMREWKVVPSNGDHAHFDSTSSRRTVNGVSSTSRSEEHTSELQSLMRISYAVFCLKKKNINRTK